VLLLTTSTTITTLYTRLLFSPVNRCSVHRFSSRVVRAVSNPAVVAESQRRVTASCDGTFAPVGSSANVHNPYYSGAGSALGR
jgi:hypothetical protein